MPTQQDIDLATGEIGAFLKLPTSYSQVKIGVARVLSSIELGSDGGFIGRPVRAEFDDEFFTLTDEQKHYCLLHEMGHIRSWQLNLPGHTALAKANVMEKYLGVRLSMDSRWVAEAEADFYASQQIGIRQAIRILAFTIPAEEERQIRLRNLLDAWAATQ
jgi:hypothetical protein